MKHHEINRRQFIRSSALLAGTALLSPWAISNLHAAAVPAAAPAGKRTAVDQMTLGKTGIKLSRLGIGTGSNSGKEQTALGREEFSDDRLQVCLPCTMTHERTFRHCHICRLCLVQMISTSGKAKCPICRREFNAHQVQLALQYGCLD